MKVDGDSTYIHTFPPTLFANININRSDLHSDSQVKIKLAQPQN